MKQINIAQGQTIFDICLQHYGSVEGMRFIMEDNPDLEVENAQAGDIIFIRPATVIDKVIKQSFELKAPVSV